MAVAATGGSVALDSFDPAVEFRHTLYRQKIHGRRMSFVGQ
ncbi:hypothetical protein ACOJBO_10325 [Rhizobium beringeri]